MYLSRFGVKNYKCLGEIDIPLTPIHAIIGQNDAGKTSLLEAIAALHASSEQTLAHVFPRPWSDRELVFHGSADPCVGLWGEWEERDTGAEPKPDQKVVYGFLVNFPRAGRSCTTDREWTRVDGKDQVLTPSSARYGETLVQRFRKGSSIPQGVDLRALEFISEILKPAHKYAFDARVMALPAAIDPTRKFRLDEDGFGLARVLLDILGYDPELFIRLRTEFCRHFQQFKGVRVESETAVQRQYDGAGGVAGSGGAAGSAVYFETLDGRSVRAQQASDGAILFLGFLGLAHLPDPPNLLLVEEPENGVYPKRLGEVIKILKEMVNREGGTRFPQIILTTHSPFVLSFFEPEEVTFLSRPKDRPDSPVRARALRDAPNIRERMGSEFYLGELWYNLSEEDLFGEV